MSMTPAIFDVTYSLEGCGSKTLWKGLLFIDCFQPATPEKLLRNNLGDTGDDDLVPNSLSRLSRESTGMRKNIGVK
jgi:hypothetical protein